MWKIFFKYSDGSKLTVTGKDKAISPRLIRKYFDDYGRMCESAIYQQYPKKDNGPKNFLEMAGVSFSEKLCESGAMRRRDESWSTKNLKTG